MRLNAFVQRYLITQLCQQCPQFIETAVYIANNIKRAMLIFQITPERLALDLDAIHLIGRGENIEIRETFTPQATQRTPQHTHLSSHHMRPKIAVRPIAIALLAQLFRQVKDDSDRQCMILTGQRQQCSAILHLHIRCIYHRQLPQCQPFSREKMHEFKGFFRNRLIVLIIGNQPTTHIRRDNLGRLKMFLRKR